MAISFKYFVNIRVQIVYKKIMIIDFRYCFFAIRNVQDFYIKFSSI